MRSFNFFQVNNFFSQCMMTSCHRRTFRFTGRLWGESIRHVLANSEHCGDSIISLLFRRARCWTSCWVANNLRRHDPHVASQYTTGRLATSVPTVYPKKYAHGFVVLCFDVIMQSFIMNSHEVFIHIHQGCFAGTGAIVRLPQCQWSKPDGYGKISQCITTTKHSKAKTVCIFLGIYCKWYRSTGEPTSLSAISCWYHQIIVHWDLLLSFQMCKFKHNLGLASYVFKKTSPWNECQGTSLMVTQHWFR